MKQHELTGLVVYRPKERIHPSNGLRPITRSDGTLCEARRYKLGDKFLTLFIEKGLTDIEAFRIIGLKALSNNTSAKWSEFIGSFEDDMSETVFLYFDKLEVLKLADDIVTIDDEVAVMLNRNDFNKFYESITQIKRMIDNDN